MRRWRREHSLLLKASKMLVSWAQASTSHSAAGGRRERHAPAAARPSPEGTQAAELPARIRQACPAVRCQGVDHPRYLLRLAELELIDREQRMVERRIKEARFPTVKSLDSFEFAAIPSLNKTAQRDSSTRQWCWSLPAASTSLAERM